MSDLSTNIAIGRRTLRDTWNICSSTSRFGFSRSMKITSGSTSTIRAQELRVVADVMDREVAVAATLLRARRAQAFLENRGANGVRVDDRIRNGRWVMSWQGAAAAPQEATSAMQEACTGSAGAPLRAQTCVSCTKRARVRARCL